MKLTKIFAIGLLTLAGGFMISSCVDQSGNGISGALDSDSGSLVLKDSARTGGGFTFLPLGMYMSVLDYDDGILTVGISNQSGYRMSYGGEYYLQKKNGDSWIDMPLPEGYVFKEGVKQIDDLDENFEKYDLSVFGKLGPGEYRLRKMDLDVSFTLVGNKS